MPVQWDTAVLVALAGLVGVFVNKSVDVALGRIQSARSVRDELRAELNREHEWRIRLQDDLAKSQKECHELRQQNLSLRQLEHEECQKKLSVLDHRIEQLEERNTKLEGDLDHAREGVRAGRALEAKAHGWLADQERERAEWERERAALVREIDDLRAGKRPRKPRRDYIPLPEPDEP